MDEFVESTGIDMNTRYGCFLTEPGMFDAPLFRISPREALQMDPLQRLCLMVTYEALQNAGYSQMHGPHASRIATYFGQTADDWRTINDQMGPDTHYVPGNNRAFIPGRLNHFFKWGGGSYCIDTACSSSSTAVYLACEALTANKCDMAVVGGGSLCVIPGPFLGLSKGGFLSSTGNCKPFVDQADGYCRGEAVGVVVLKRLKLALADRDNVLAMISGAARNSNAGGGSITHPSVDSQKTGFDALLRNAGVLDVNEIGYVEIHGTGTQAGDTAEMQSVRETFAQRRPPDNPLYIGAVKANVGHSEAAAGIVSLIKAIMVLQKSVIPRQPGYPFKINRKFGDLEKSNIRIADGRSRFERRKILARKVVIHSSDAAGGNTSILLQDPPTRERSQARDPRSHHIVLCSGRTQASLAANKALLRTYLTQWPESDLASVAYTTTARRMCETQRTAFVASSTGDLLRQLREANHEETASPPAANTPIIFIFTGQGSQYTGMGSELYRTSPTFRMLIDSYQEISTAQNLESISFMDIIDGTQDISSATTTQVHTALTVLEIALAQYWQTLGIRPSLVIGHSLGEYAALCVAGVLSVSDTLHLVHKRALLIQEHCDANAGGMLAVPLSAERIQSSLGPKFDIACINAPERTVVSGALQDLQSLQSELGASRVQTRMLDVRYAFHSGQMEPMLEHMERMASEVQFHAPQIPVASTLHGRIVRESGSFHSEYLTHQMRRPVDFVSAVQAAEASGFCPSSSIVIEIGPHPVSLGDFKACLQRASPTCHYTIKQFEPSWRSISACLASFATARGDIDWGEFHKDFAGSVALLDLPTYAFDLQNFWRAYEIEQRPTNTQDTVPPALHSHLGSTTLHKVLSCEAEVDRHRATFATWATDPRLAQAVRGHLVGGVPICPASIFVDMAYTATKYIVRQAGRDTECSDLRITGLDMVQPLVIHENDATRIIETTAALDKDSCSVNIQFNSKVGGMTINHGSCTVAFGDEQDFDQQHWPRIDKLIRSRFNSMVQPTAQGATHQMSKAVFYKLFASAVEYSEPYQAVDIAHISPDFTEIAARLSFADTTGLGQFVSNPFTVDAMVHSPGFLLNSALSSPAHHLHVANRVGSLRVVRNISAASQYLCYSQIRAAKNGTAVGDVYTFDDEGLVAECTGIHFQRLDRDVFTALINRSAPTQPPQQEPPMAQWTSPHISTSNSHYLPSDGSTEAEDPPGPAEALLELVTSKTGLSPEDLPPSASFADLGIDSLMSLVILADFKRVTGVELPAGMFTKFPTVSSLRQELNSIVLKSDLAPNATTQRQRALKKAPVTERFLGIVGEQLGTDLGDMRPDTEFASLGVDSMLAIKILSVVEAETGQTLPAEFFTSNSTVGEARVELARVSESDDVESTQVNTDAERPSLAESVSVQSLEYTSSSSPGVSDCYDASRQNTTEAHDAGASRVFEMSTLMPRPKQDIVSRAVLIQGRPRSHENPMFLLPDGTGSAASYIYLSPLPRGRRMYALESPFLDNPNDFTLTTQDLAKVFVSAIRKVQPNGPYMLGGWSAGCASALEVAYQLTQDGAKIDLLLLIDLRVPRALSKEVEITPELVAKTGIFGLVDLQNMDETAAENQKWHVTKAITALVNYEGRPFPIEKRPRSTHVVWATQGVNESMNRAEHNPTVSGWVYMAPLGDEEKPLDQMAPDDFMDDLKKWFYAARCDFGPNGWERLVGENIIVHTVQASKFTV